MSDLSQRWGRGCFQNGVVTPVKSQECFTGITPKKDPFFLLKGGEFNNKRLVSRVAH